MNAASPFLAFCLVFTWLSAVHASSAADVLLEEYQREGAGPFNAEAGKALWHRSFASAGSPRSRGCAACHSADPRKAGRLQRPA